MTRSLSVSRIHLWWNDKTIIKVAFGEHVMKWNDSSSMGRRHQQLTNNKIIKAFIYMKRAKATTRIGQSFAIIKILTFHNMAAMCRIRIFCWFCLIKDCRRDEEYRNRDFLLLFTASKKIPPACDFVLQFRIQHPSNIFWWLKSLSIIFKRCQRNSKPKMNDGWGFLVE